MRREICERYINRSYRLVRSPDPARPRGPGLPGGRRAWRARAGTYQR